MNRLKKLIVGLAAAVCAAAAGTVAASAYDKNTTLLLEYEQTAASGTVNAAVKGTYINDAANALKRINEIRYEACKEGVWDPRDSSRRLTLSDYVPIKWSCDLEQIARVRAAEAGQMTSHTRPNGESCFTVELNGCDDGSMEVLAWNWSDNMVYGINQFYEEKSDWVNKVSRAVTGHYTSMISPSSRYVGLGCFVSENNVYYNATAGRFSYYAGASEKQSAGVKDCYVPVNIRTSSVVSAAVKCVSGSTSLSKGETASFELQGKINVQRTTDALFYSAKWSSSDTSVATVDKYGKVTAKSTGSAKITAAYAGKKYSVDVKVLPSISDCKITIPYASYTYRGRGIKPTVTVKNGTAKLTKGTDYTVSYSNNTNAGTATITVTGKGSWSGKATKTFTVKPLDVSSSYAKVTIPYASYTYTGSAIRPAVTVAFKDGSVIPVSEFGAVYASNIKVGKAKITVTGKSANVTGTLTKYFVVKPAKQTVNSITAGKGSFRITWNKDLQASGYQVLYSRDKSFETDVHSWTTFDLSDTAENFSKVPQSGETWYVKLRSFTAQNNTRYGNYSAVKTVTVK